MFKWGALVFTTRSLIIKKLFKSIKVFLFLHSKNMFLPLKLTKSKVVDEEGFLLFINF
jgi:hypothetical protein